MPAGRQGLSQNLYHWAIAFFVVGFSILILGFIDDAFGESSSKGFKGHFSAIKQKKITTGLLKAVLGFVVSLIGAYLIYKSLILIFLAAFTLVLFINFFNLLDLRPGRASKTFLFFILIAIVFSLKHSLWPLVLPILGPVLVLFYLDLAEIAMLGDTGSNFLGAVFGLIFIYIFSVKAMAGALIILVIIHFYSEKHSISTFIEKTAFLRWIDSFGTKINKT